MDGMTAVPKVKISISIDAVLLANIDRYAAANHVTRSGALERWLRQVSHSERLTRLEEETAAYYDALTATERREDDALAEASLRNFKKLAIDAGSPTTVAPRARKNLEKSPKRRSK